MNIKIKEKDRIICSNPNSLHNYFAWPSVARLCDGSLMAVASGFRVAHICPFGKVVAVRSYDGGKSWTAPEAVIDTLLDDRDGGVLAYGENVIVTSFNNTHKFQRESANKYKNYVNSYLDVVEKIEDSEKYLGSTAVFSTDGGKTFSGLRTVPISSPHGPCRLSDGRILYVGRPFADADELEHQEKQLECHIMDENGDCTLLSKIENVDPRLLSCEPHAIQLSSGRIIVHIRLQGNIDGKNIFTVYQSVSDDMGKTFSKPKKLLRDDGGSPAHLIEHSSGAVVSVYGYRNAPYGIRAMISYDGGESWESDIVLADNGCSWDIGYPASVELENGDILTVYYEHLSDDSSVIKQIIWNFERNL